MHIKRPVPKQLGSGLAETVRGRCGGDAGTDGISAHEEDTWSHKKTSRPVGLAFLGQ